MGIERTPTLIPGLDIHLTGGIPKGSSVLISGGPGTGKTILGMQYIYEGAKRGEAGLYVTLEESLTNVIWNMQNFQWDIKKYQDEGLMKIYRLHLTATKNIASIEEQIKNELETISLLVKEINAKRLVIDSTTAIGLWVTQPGQLRHILFEFADYLKTLGCTTLLISETGTSKTQFSAFGVEEFVTDGVIALYFTPPHRSLFIRKMRATNHSKSVHPFDISDAGITVSKDEILWDALK